MRISIEIERVDFTENSFFDWISYIMKLFVITAEIERSFKNM